MAPVKVNVDYYAVLEISNTATLETVTKSYRRLVKIRHPDRNRNKDDSTAVFQLVSPVLFQTNRLSQQISVTNFIIKLQNAYETISDPEKRRAYDAQWKGIRDSIRVKQGSNRSRTRTAETEKGRKIIEATNQMKENEARKERLQQLENSTSRYCNDILEVRRMIKILTADLEGLQDHDHEDLKQKKEPSGWLLKLASLFYRTIDETNEQKQAREVERLHRVASRTIKQSELLEQEVKLQRLQDAVQKLQSEIKGEKQKSEAQAKASQERVESKRAAATSTAAAAAAAAAAAVRKNAQNTTTSRPPATPSSSSSSSNSSSTATTTFAPSSGSTESAAAGSCQHHRFWPKIEGRQFCRKCCTFQGRFAFQCPDCRTIACASCRQSLRGENR